MQLRARRWRCVRSFDSWREVQLDARVLAQPGTHPGVLVGSVVAADHVQLRRATPEPPVEEGKELLRGCLGAQH